MELNGSDIQLIRITQTYQTFVEYKYCEWKKEKEKIEGEEESDTQ